MNYSDIIKSVADNTDLPKEIVDKTYKAYWKSIRDIIQQLPLKEELSEETFDKLNSSINIPSLGKLYVDKDKYIKSKKRFNNINKLKNK